MSNGATTNQQWLLLSVLQFRSPSAMSNRSGGYSCHIGPNPAQPEIHVIKLHKSNNGMGLSIVAAKGAGQDRLGIYIKSVVAGGAADADGRLTAGDQLLKVDGQSLVGITQEKAAEYLMRTGPVVTLEVAKQGAIYHGLATLLSQPSPVMTRASKVRPKSEHFEIPSLQEPSEQPPTSHSMGNLLSVPRHATNQDYPGPMMIDQPSGPRRMSERDLPSRLGRDTTTPQQQMHISKSVPALHNVGTEGKQQHEVFNPGYSRASSSNSVTPPVQPPPMPAINGATSLRSRSSHNLHDPMRIGTLPPSGLVSRQQSSPNLNPGQTIGSGVVLGPGGPSVHQSNEAERFYQNLSIYRNQDAPNRQRQSPSQHPDDRSPLQPQKNSRGSQNSLNRPNTLEQGQARDRPISAYIPQSQQQGYLGGQMVQQQGCAAPPRSQSSRDIIRQEAKLQEMQEEVRRRELRGGVPTPLSQHRPAGYNARSSMIGQSVASIVRPTKPLGSTPNLGPSGSGSMIAAPPPSVSMPSQVARQTGIPSYSYSDPSYGSYGVQYGKQQPSPGLVQYSTPPTARGKNEMVRSQHPGAPLEYGRESMGQDGRSYTDQPRGQFASSQNIHYYPNGNTDSRNGQYSAEAQPIRAQSAQENAAPILGTDVAPVRPALPEDGFRESPPPPPPNTSTHPLYSKPSDSSRYTASMQDPPRGGYYPAAGVGTSLQPRQYQYSATNPWQREEREKEQARRREAARQWRDQQIAELGAMPRRSAQQDEQLRALQLERDFQKRAEEAANQQDEDDEENNDLESTESMQRVQGLLRTAVSQERNNLSEQHHRTNLGNQTVRGNLVPQPLGTSMHSAVQSHGIVHGAQQQASQNTAHGQQDNSGFHLQSNIQHQQPNQIQGNAGQQPPPISPTYGSPLTYFGTGQKSNYPHGMSQATEDREMQRRIDEVKRKQAEFDEIQKKREEEVRQQQQQQQLQIQQMYQHQHHQQQQQQTFKGQQPMHPSMLRLDSLVINGPSTPSAQNGNNEAPPPPERGSSYAVMSQQSALRSNSSTASSIMALATASQPPTSIKRVSFHDSNANAESLQRNASSGALNVSSSAAMDIIREDPNNFINDAENLLASPKTPEGTGSPFTGSTPGVIGAQEVYKDPRTKRLAEKQKQQQQQQNSQIGAVPEKLSFKEKMKMFAMETGEDGTPRDKVKISRAQREIDNIGSPLSPPNSNNNNNNNTANSNNNSSGSSTNNNRN